MYKRQYQQQPGYGQQPYGGNPYGGGMGGEQVQIPGVGLFAKASVGNRFLARLIDGLIVGVPLAIINFIISNAMAPSAEEITASIESGDFSALSAGPNLFLTAFITGALMAVLSGAYEVVMLSMKGATVGKLAMGLRVVTAQSAHNPAGALGGGPAAIRWAVLYAGAIVPIVGPIWVLVCVLSPLFDSQSGQGFHDKAAKTWVISVK